MAFDNMFPKPGGGSPAPTRSAPAPGGAGTPGTPAPSAQAMIEQFVQYAKSENLSEEEIVEFVMEAIIAAGYQPPPEEEVARLVSEAYKGAPAGAPAQTPGGPAGGAPTASPAGGLPGGGAQLPLR